MVFHWDETTGCFRYAWQGDTCGGVGLTMAAWNSVNSHDRHCRIGKIVLKEREGARD